MEQKWERSRGANVNLLSIRPAKLSVCPERNGHTDRTDEF
jgi:hypothetical protein